MHRLVAVDRDDERLPESAGAFQIAQVSDVENIEAPVGKNDLFASEQRRQFFKTAKLHDASFSTAAANSW